ncbi:GGDEF domain-containing protein [Ideonella sp. A 288]|uniref:GGDEF domain-containing protein n=1 Tax=Ideonella sp. A 288 TaxID=1962181 RepID=UPI0011863ED6|nr:GGDEF domain-containing protein [Ideonella sp. A 288]
MALTLWTLMLLELLLACGWAMAAWRLDVPRQAAAHWAAFSLGGALSLGVLLGVPNAPATPAAIGLSSLGTVISLLCMRRGLLLFLRLPPADGEALAVAMPLAVTAALGAGWPAVFPDVVRVVVMCTAVLWLMSRTAAQAWDALRGEFGDTTAFAVLWPLVACIALVVLRLTAALVWPDVTGRLLPAEGPFHVALALVLLVLTLLVHGSLASVVLLRMVARLRHLSQRDALTGLFNRAELMQQLEARHRMLVRYGEPFAVLIIDVDHFKSVNDTLGHAAGDAVLINVAQVLNASARDVDVLGRLGGEEFCVLLPHTDAASARLAAERLRLAIADGHITWRQHAVWLTVSVGLAHGDDPDESPSHLLERADQALYQAKHSGRNRTIVWRPSFA